MEKRGQVWIETVLYTLIALVLIGMVLAFITPRITEAQDRALVEQTVSALNVFDDKVSAVLLAPGNVRTLDFTLKRGNLYIDTVNDKITIEIIDLSKPYSEPGTSINEGRVKIYSEQGQKLSSVNLTLDYSNIAVITYSGDSAIVKKFGPVNIPYRISIENKGAISTPTNLNPPPTVDISENS